jgi:PAS domain S-box-containing protein
VPVQWEEAAFLQARTTSKELSRVENKLFLGASEQLQQTRWSVYATLIGALIVSGALSAGLFATFLLDIKRRLAIIAKNAERLAIGEQLAPPPRWARDEIAELDQALHQASRILDDVRHKELTILENAADVICSLDSKLRFRAAGAVVEKLWQYAGDDLLGMSLLTLLATDDLDAIRQAFQRVREQGEGEIECPIVCKDGKVKNLLWKVSWSDAEDTFFCVVHDVTELRAIEKLKRHFIAIVSHDLRTPLTSVGVCLAFLLAGRRGPIPDEVRKLLDMAEKSATRLMDLVNELLELEKLNSGKFTLSPVCVSISDVSAAAKESLRLTADLAKVSLKGPIGDVLAFADQARLIQVVTNLLANAISYSPEDTTVRLSIVRSSSEFVQLRVSDQGPSIPLEERSSIFDKFQRPGSPYSVSLRHTGLGLAVVKAIVEAHGGQVGIDSNDGKGNVFWITLPRYRDEEEDDP